MPRSDGAGVPPTRSCCRCPLPAARSPARPALGGVRRRPRCGGALTSGRAAPPPRAAPGRPAPPPAPAALSGSSLRADGGGGLRDFAGIPRAAADGPSCAVCFSSRTSRRGRRSTRLGWGAGRRRWWTSRPGTGCRCWRAASSGLAGLSGTTKALVPCMPSVCVFFFPCDASDTRAAKLTACPTAGTLV